ncbi:MAG: hypothetical protein ACI4M6_01665 [Christensenellaceae bacterium]
MKNKFKTLFLALALLTLTLTFTVAYSEKPQKSLAVETTLDTPVTDNGQKNYKSNIPDVWHDESRQFGIDFDNLSFEAGYYIDFISTDGTKNYANDKIINVEIGQTLEFYLEIGAEYASPATISDGFSYKISNDSSIFSVNVSLNYNQIEHTLYDNSVNSAELSFTDDLENANKPFFLEFDPEKSAYDYTTLSKNPNYKLMKFAITANQVGADVFNLSYGEGNSKNVFVNVVDGNGDGKIIPTLASFSTDLALQNDLYSSTLSGTYYSGELKDKYICLYKGFPCEISTPNLPLTAETTDYSTNFSNVSVILSSLTTQDTSVQITQPYYGTFYLNLPSLGEYKFNATTTIEVNSSGFDSMTETELIEIDFTFSVYCYDKTCFKPSNYVETDENGNYLYPTDHSINYFIPFAKTENGFIVDFTVNGENVTDFSSKTYKTEQAFSVNGSVTDSYLQNMLNESLEEFLVGAAYKYELTLSGTYEEKEPLIAQYKETQRSIMTQQLAEKYGVNAPVSYAVKTILSKDLLEKPTVETNAGMTGNEIKIDLAKQDGQTVLNVKNWQNLANKSVISIQTDYENANLSDGIITINDYREISALNLDLICDYGVYGKQTNSYTVSFIDSRITYSLSQKTATLNIGEALNVEVSIENNVDNLISESKIDYNFISENGNVSAEKSSSSNLSITVKPLNVGIDTLTIIAKHEGSTIFVNTLHVTIIARENITDTQINFVQGNDIKIYLSSLSNTVDITVDYALSTTSDGFSWLSFNNSILEVRKLSANSARITALREGSTKVVALYQLPDGSSLHAICNVSVLASKPEIDITFTKRDATAFSMYDNVCIGVNTHGFNLSDNVSAVWSIDGENISDALDADGNEVPLQGDYLTFYKKFSPGYHTVKVELTDNVYDLNLSCEKQIYIATTVNQKRELSFNESQVNLVYTASKTDVWVTSVLLDGVLSNEYEYKWISSDASILRVMSNGATVSIEPLKKGSATVTVYCDLNHSGEENYISRELQVTVDEIENIELVSQNAYPRPGENVVIDVKINGTTGYKNLSLPFTVLSNGAPCEYEFTGGQIFVNDLQSGNLTVSTAFGEQTNELKLTVTNFNIKKIITVALPYLVIFAVIAIIVLVVLKARSNPYKSIGKKIDKLDAMFADSIKNIQANKTKKVVDKEYRRLLKAINQLIAKFSYHYDEGRDECKTPLTHTLSIKKILLALINTCDKNYLKADDILTTVSEKHILQLEKMYEEILTSLKLYEQKVNEQNNKDKEEARLKKVKKSIDDMHEDQLTLLKNQGLIDDDDNID